MNFKEAKKDKRQTEEKVGRGRNIVLNVDISFLEAIHGTKRMVEYHRNSTWNNCKGSGRESKSNDWSEWNGTGYVNIRHGKSYSQHPWKKWSKKDSWR